DLRLRRPLLYPTELRAHWDGVAEANCQAVQRIWIIRSVCFESMPFVRLIIHLVILWLFFA
ncbi:MAG: hypothetical protein RSG77_11080, partial [Hafnia sp.]|uniref:hypothetical protein n=1 Tax=Hafnia sp. TaxID=1873498 RepID=UPI002FCBC86B